MSKFFVSIVKIAKKIKADATEVPVDEYYNTLHNYYEGDKDFVNFTIYNDKIAEQLFLDANPKAKVKTKTNGNTFIRYIETKEAYIILGLIARGGKLGKSDLKDALAYIEELKEVLKSGKKIVTSCNEKSRKLLERLKKEFGGRLVIEKMAEIDLSQGKWENLICYLK